MKNRVFSSRFRHISSKYTYDAPKDGYDSKKIDSVMACFVMGGRNHSPACSFDGVGYGL